MSERESLSGEELAEITANVLQCQRTNAYDLPTVAKHRAVLLAEVDRAWAELARLREALSDALDICDEYASEHRAGTIAELRAALGKDGGS
jgi:hypothetical protein